MVSITQGKKGENQSVGWNQWTSQGKGQVVKKSPPFTAHMTGMLSWMATDSLGKTGQQGEVVELLCM